LLLEVIRVLALDTFTSWLKTEVIVAEEVAEEFPRK